MTEGVEVRGTHELERVAAAFREGDKDLQRAVGAAMRKAAKPLAESVTRSGAAAMPHRGGLAARIAAGRASVTASLRGSRPKVSIALRTREGYGLRAMDQGILRHPVFAQGDRARVWTTQRVPSGAFSRAFAAGASKAADEVIDAAQGVLDDIARKA